MKAKHEVCREARVSQHIPNTLHAEVTSSDSTPDSADMVTSVSTPVHQLEVTEVAETTVAPPERSSQTPWRVVEPHCPYPAAETTPVSVGRAPRTSENMSWRQLGVHQLGMNPSWIIMENQSDIGLTQLLISARMRVY